MRISPLALGSAALSVAVLGTGCSVSWSLSKSADSVSSISRSSSPEKGVGQDKLPFEDDVANLSMSVAGSAMSPQSFSTALTRLAAQHRITDWSEEKATYYGIGRGLRKAGINPANIENQRFLQDVFISRPEAIRWINEGYGR